jgi:hypothetical protein
MDSINRTSTAKIPLAAAPGAQRVGLVGLACIPCWGDGEEESPPRLAPPLSIAPPRRFEGGAIESGDRNLFSGQLLATEPPLNASNVSLKHSGPVGLTHTRPALGIDRTSSKIHHELAPRRESETLLAVSGSVAYNGPLNKFRSPVIGTFAIIFGQLYSIPFICNYTTVPPP